MNLTWRQLAILTAGITAVMVVVALIGGEAYTTWGIYLYMATTTHVVAALMTWRITMEHLWERRAARRAGRPVDPDIGWTPRVFVFTAWQWGVGGLFFFLAYRISDLPEPNDTVNAAIRIAVGVVATLLLVVLRWVVGRKRPPLTTLAETVLGRDGGHRAEEVAT